MEKFIKETLTNKRVSFIFKKILPGCFVNALLFLTELFPHFFKGVHRWGLQVENRHSNKSFALGTVKVNDTCLYNLNL